MAGDYLLVVLGPNGDHVPGKPGATRIFHEEDDAHPYGEVLVTTADRAVKAANTRAVREALASGLLKDVTGTMPEAPRPPDMADIIDGKLDRPPEGNAPAGKGK